jgi:hypothetical protein
LLTVSPSGKTAKILSEGGNRGVDALESACLSEAFANNNLIWDFVKAYILP